MAAKQPDKPRTTLAGMSLPPAAYNELVQVGIRADSKVALAFQEGAQRHVLSATESGGSTVNIGHYVGYLEVEGQAPYAIVPTARIIANQIHKRIFAPALIRIEAFRYHTTYDIVATLIWIATVEGSPVLASRNLFAGHLGYCEHPLWQTSDPMRGTATPRFITSAGEPRPTPPMLDDALARITEAVCCVNCRHHRGHFFDALPVAVPIPAHVPPPAAQKKRPKKAKKHPTTSTPAEAPPAERAAASAATATTTS